MFAILSVSISDVPNTSAADNPLISASKSVSLHSQFETKDIDSVTRSSVEKSYGKLPLNFEVNNGQVDDAVKFLSRGSGYTLFLTSNEVVLSLRCGPANDGQQRPIDRARAAKPKPVTHEVIRLKSIGSNPNPEVTGLDELPAKSNYLIGNDPSKWSTDVSNYAKVKLEDVYPGIDLIYYGNQRQLEYDWIVAPGADPRTIKFKVESEAELKIDNRGNLILDEKGELRLNRPFIYQRREGSHREIAGRYILLGRQEVGFQLDKYDSSLALVIDPVLSYSTYIGGSDTDAGYGIAVDSSGNAYVTGSTWSINFPTASPFQASNGGIGYSDVFVTKLNASGSALVYSTYLGGGNSDIGYGIAVDSSGNAYVTGWTDSTDFPTLNPLQI